MSESHKPSSGKVYLVGAGPGDRRFLTLQAQVCLTQAEVLVYDALVDKRLLENLPSDCLKIHVGKRGGQPSTPQDQINRLLITYYQQGKQVVRLKGGDPFIFGRSTTEIDALIQAGCDVEVVPGLSSALAAPLLAGIPLTDTVLSQCFAVVTGHDLEAIRWEALTQLDTLVILMGTRHLDILIDRLIQHGQSSKTPIAIIRWAGQPQQQVWTGTLETIVQQTARQSLSPAVIVIGEVVNLRPYLHAPSTSRNTNGVQLLQPVLNSTLGADPPNLSVMNATHLNTTPLSGKTVLVTRSASQSSEFSDRLRDQGAHVIEMPALEIGPPSSWADLDGAIARLHEFDWLILTSANGVQSFFQRLQAQQQDARSLHSLKVAVVGQKTAQSLENYGIRPDFVPPDFIADALVTHFPEPSRLDGMQILFPRVESGGRASLVKELTARGAIVTEIAAYESRCPSTIPPEALNALQRRALDVITFASSKTVKNFYHLVESSADLVGEPLLPMADWLDAVCIASIGPQTSAACQQWLGRVDIEAQDYTLEGLTHVIVQWASAKPISP